jgi:transcriptional regulator with XRE-family HTH domain
MKSGFADTLPRLLGMHNLSGARFALYLGVSAQYVSFLLSGERRPTDERLAQIADIFGIAPARLLSAPFEDLLRVELADPARYRDTEQRIDALRREAEDRAPP